MSQERVTMLREQMNNVFQEEGWVAPMAAALKGLTAEQAAWQPAEAGHTIWQLVNHLVFWEGLYLNRLNGGPSAAGQIANDTTFGPPGNPTDEAGWQATMDRMFAVHAGLRQAVDRLEDANLDQAFAGGKLGLVLGDLIMHDAYHLGQIMLLRKQQGGWPQSR